MKNVPYIILPVFVLSTCGGGSGEIVNLPTGESGYASGSIDLDTVGESVAASPRLQGGDFSSPPTVGISTVNLSFEDTANVDEFIVTFDGVPVTVNWDPVDSRFEGVSGDIEVWVSPMFLSDNNQLGFVWMNLFDDRGSSAFRQWGPTLVGFNTDPNAVSGRSDIATFSGTGNISINAVDNTFWTSANGPANLSVDFGGGTLSGTIDLTDCGCGFGGAGIDPTTITLANGSISGNTFSVDATLDLADLNLASFSNVVVDGEFFETNATAVGGYFEGTGTSNIGGIATTMIGAFAADQD